MIDLCGKHRLVVSMAGTAHLSNDNAGVPRFAKKVQKCHVDHKRNSLLDAHIHYEYKL